MPSDYVSYQNSDYFTDLIYDYLNHNNVEAYYNRFPTVENFGLQIQEKALNFDNNKRQILFSSLQSQYSKSILSELTKRNIDSLTSGNTFTVTTGHQLNLFTGPLYFLYKIISVINLCKILKTSYPDKNFVPIYWLASEDHDFAEINYFNLNGKKIVWNSKQNGAVGRFSTEGLEEVLKIFEREIGVGKNADYLVDLFKKAYLENDNLAAATRFLANELFGKYGLVIIDGDEKNLKNEFAPFVQNELLHQQSVVKINETILKLSKYKIQANPRDINLFYLENGVRERIILENGYYKINNTEIKFTKDEILNEVRLTPEKFSPNALLRPLYQEVILPNLSYIGGGGEIAYWLELKSMFAYHHVTFPILLLRNAALIVTKKQVAKANRLDLNWNQLFLKLDALLILKVKQLSTIQLDLLEQKNALRKQFAELYKIVNETDKSFFGAVKAQEAKQLKGLENLEKRLLKAQKRKYQEVLTMVTELKNELFPNDGLQERKANFSSFYNENLIDDLLCKLDPLVSEFSIIEV